MANLKAIRIRITSVKSTRQITSAMKMVSAAKLRKAQDKIVRLRPYANKLYEILVGLNQSLADSEIENVYGRQSSPEKVLIVVITSNRGLCGAFNTNVIKETRRIITEKYSEQYKNNNVWLLPIGKKGYDFFRKLKINMLQDQNNLLHDLTFDNVAGVAEQVMKSFTLKEFDRIELVYNQFKNAAVQILTNEQFLPVSTITEGKTALAPTDYIYEPTQEEIVKELIPKSLKIQFYKAILNSFVAEHGARMTSMHKATDNATSMIRDLTLQYNKARQATITNQILEVVSGAEALRG
ncbi:MAG: ATP synthase F1 subunit gamma [Bacteroidales bacterium]|nr:ATP synthase F1 subunit gamma [Bacteroidales bacterium]MBK7625841.1 ATP synthase F1 subunit gamma [Bacteroidales bacterium]